MKKSQITLSLLGGTSLTSSVAVVGPALYSHGFSEFGSEGEGGEAAEERADSVSPTSGGLSRWMKEKLEGLGEKKQREVLGFWKDVVIWESTVENSGVLSLDLQSLKDVAKIFENPSPGSAEHGDSTQSRAVHSQGSNGAVRSGPTSSFFKKIKVKDSPSGSEREMNDEEWVNLKKSLCGLLSFGGNSGSSCGN